MAEQVTSHGDGVFITAVVLLVAVMLFVMGFAGLGSPGYSPFAILLLLGAGGATYFALRGAGEFGMKEAGSTLFIAGLAVLMTAALPLFASRDMHLPFGLIIMMKLLEEQRMHQFLGQWCKKSSTKFLKYKSYYYSKNDMKNIL